MSIYGTIISRQSLHILNKESKTYHWKGHEMKTANTFRSDSSRSRYRRMRALWIAAIVLGTSLTLSACSEDDDDPVAPQPQSNSMIRVLHMSYDAPAVDVWVDGSKAISNLAYGESSGYATVPAGTRSITVVPAGQTEPAVISADLPIPADQMISVLAVDALSSIDALVAMDAEPSDMARVRFIHTVPDAPAVDIKVNDGNGSSLFSAVGFGMAADYIDVPGGTYNLAVTAHGSTDALVTFGNVTLANGKVYTVIAKGTLNAQDNYPFMARTFIDNDNGDMYVDLTPVN